MHLSDRCLEMCLSLDCLNDMQLLLQYENWIIHTFLDGDQSKQTFRSDRFVLTARLPFMAETEGCH